MLYRSVAQSHRGLNQSGSYTHLTHCLDWIRQDTICEADDVLFPSPWRNMTDPHRHHWPRSQILTSLLASATTTNAETLMRWMLGLRKDHLAGRIPTHKVEAPTGMLMRSSNTVRTTRLSSQGSGNTTTSQRTGYLAKKTSKEGRDMGTRRGMRTVLWRESSI